MADEPRRYRSAHSYGKADRDGFIHHSWMKTQGFPEGVFDGRPIISIWEAGGLPLEFPAMPPGETQMRPTAMLFRNLLAMEVEESIRGNPIDWARRSVLPERDYLERHDAPVLQANSGCDLDFLVGASGDRVARASH